MKYKMDATRARRIVALDILARTTNYQDASWCWEEYPDVGEHDFEKIMRIVNEENIRPSDEDLTAAIAFLAKRAGRI